MRDTLAVAALIILIAWGLCATGYLTPAEVRAGLAELLGIAGHALLALARLAGG